MHAEAYDDIFKNQGFQQIGVLYYRLALRLWWHPEASIEVICLTVGSITTIKATKSYYLKSISENGQTWARDIPALHDYLETHFPEMHLAFSHFRDVTSTLAARQVLRQQGCRAISSNQSSVTHLACLQRQLHDNRQALKNTETLLDLDTGSSDLLLSYLRGQVQSMRRDTETLGKQIQKEEEKRSLHANLLSEYERKGSAACLVFSINSNIHTVDSPPDFGDALASTMKELQDFHRFQITQKLCGSRLNIQIAEATEPILIYQEQRLGGAFSPRQLDKLTSEYKEYVNGAMKHTMVIPDEDIRVDGHVKADKKLLSARIVSTMLQRLDLPEQEGFDLSTIPKHDMPARIGLIVDRGRSGQKPCHIPLVRLDNVYISGTTGSGKSYNGRVLIEEAAQNEGLNILVLDPRNQAAGLLVPEDRETILSLYPKFGMRLEDARGYQFQYFAPSVKAGNGLPADLSKLGCGRVIVSFKGLTDHQRCELFRDILNAVFNRYAREESPSLQLMIFVEEAQNFTKKKVSEDAKKAGEQAEIALDRIVREGRKYGCCTVIISQTIRDFAYDSASIRQNTNTKVFLHNSDREIDYASDFLNCGRRIVQLRPGTAILYNANWGAIEVKVRPPLSKVWEFSVEYMHRLLQHETTPGLMLSSEAKRLLKTVEDHTLRVGVGPNLTQVGEYLGISSKRRVQQLVDVLEQAGVVKTRKLPQRGNPRIIELVSSEGAD